MNKASSPYCGMIGHLAGLARRTAVLTTVLGLALVSACAGTRGGPIPYNVQNFGAPDRPVALTVSDDYRIAPLDTLGIAIYPVETLNRDVQVDLRGTINMPLIGEIKAIDLTTSQLQALIATKLGEKYLQSPQVAVTLKASTRSSVTLDGSVNQPGTYPITGAMTLMEAVAQARGVDSNANPKRVAVFRQIKGQRMAAAFDLTTIRRGEAEDPRIYAGDIIVVDGSDIKAAQREILQSLPLLRFLTY